MNARSSSYERAATAITPIGSIIGSVLQNAIYSNNLYFTSGIQSNTTFGPEGLLVENTTPYYNGVKGQVLIKGGGIFLSDSMDELGYNRQYTSAITPAGINASVITTGRLDTEKINIYSGNQLRFSWNAAGLLAYDMYESGETNYNTFVKYNEDGLNFFSRW